MGSFLSGVLGTNSQYQASPYQQGNPYGQSVLQGEVNNQAQIYAQQQALGNQLQGLIQGNGPNPAQTQYLQNVNQNNLMAQGLLSGQRNLNPALAAKMGVNAASNANQQAAQQSSLLQQNQQLGALQGYQNLLGQQQQGNLAQQQLYVAPNTAAMQTNAAVANANQQSARGIVGGLLGAVGSGAQVLTANQGGLIKSYASGGQVSSGPLSEAGQFLGKSISGQQDQNQDPMSVGIQNLGMGASSLIKNLRQPSINQMPAVGGMSEPMSNPDVMNAARGGKINNYLGGGHVKGKAQVSGDSLKNDTVPAMLSPGEIVLPRTVVNAPNAPDHAKKFVEALLARENLKKGKK